MYMFIQYCAIVCLTVLWCTLQVEYDNHSRFHNGKKIGAKANPKGSPVRIFTSVSPRLIELPAEDGYRWGSNGLYINWFVFFCFFCSMYTLILKFLCWHNQFLSILLLLMLNSCYGFDADFAKHVIGLCPKKISTAKSVDPVLQRYDFTILCVPVFLLRAVISCLVV